MSGVTMISDFAWFCPFAWANDDEPEVQEEGMALVPAFEDAEGVGFSVPVLLASKGKPKPPTKKQTL
jgi:hypothetical protein